MTSSSGARLVVSLLALALVVAVIGITTTEARLVQARPDDPWTVPDPLSGFPVNLSGSAIYEGSPTLADLDGDEKLDIVVGGSDASNPKCLGRLYAVKWNGDILWDIATRAPIQSTPAVDDIDGDGVQEVVVGLGYPDSEGCANGGLLAVNGLTGAQEWLFDTQDWNLHRQNGFTDAVFSSPAVAEISGDGSKGIAFGSYDQCIYMLDGNGNPLWSWHDPNRCGGQGYYNQDTVWSSPAIADLDGDGTVEIISGADITAGNRNGDPSGGYLYVFDVSGNVLARKWFDQTIYSSPAVGDIDADGELEIVVGTGVYLAGTGYYVTAWNFNSGAEVTAALVQKGWWTTGGRVFSSPALVDLNGNGGLDVVAIANVGDGPWTGGADNGSKVYAWDGKTGNKLFETMICDSFGNAFNVHASPTIADIDGDGSPEILFSHSWEVGILNHDGTYYTDYSSVGVNNPACARTHDPTTNLTFWAANSAYGTPAIGDVDGNGSLEVVVGGGQDGNGPNKDYGALYAWKPTGTGTDAPWPMFRHDRLHTGRYASPPELDVAPNYLYILHQYGGRGTESAHLSVKNIGGGSMSWAVSSKPANVSTSPSSGSVDTMVSVDLTLTVSGYSTGTHSLGNIVITGTVSGEPVEGSPKQIPVTLYVGRVNYAYLPVTLRSTP